MMKISVFACLVLIYANPDHYGVTAQKPKMTPSVKELLIQEGDELRLSCQGDGGLQFSAPSYVQLEVEQSNFTSSFDNSSNTYTFIRSKTIRGDTGWYACAEENVMIVNDEKTIDHPEDEISWVYVYVNSSKPFIATEGRINFISTWSGERAVIPCRTTSPSLPVILLLNNGDIWLLEEAYFDPKIGFITNGIRNDREMFRYRCAINGADEMKMYLGSEYFLFTRKKILQFPIIKINAIRRVLWGEDLTLSCNVNVPKEAKIFMDWEVPNSIPQEKLYYSEISKQSAHAMFESLFDNWQTTLTIKNVTETDGDEYICIAKDEYDYTTNSSVVIKTWDPSYTFINVTATYRKNVSDYVGENAYWYINIETYPDIEELYWCNPNGIRINNTGKNSKYTYDQGGVGWYFFAISNLVIEDSGNYSGHVSTAHNKTNFTLSLTVLNRRPEVSIEYIRPYFTPGESAEVVCSTTSKFLPNVTWSYKEYPDFPSKENIVYRSPSNIPREQMDNDTFRFILISRLNITINMTGDLVCSCCDAIGCTKATKQILVSDVAGRYGVVGPGTVLEGDDINLTCGSSVYYFTNGITWTKSGISPAKLNQTRIRVTKNQTKFTFQSVLQIRNVRTSDHGIYNCQATNRNNQVETITHELIVLEALSPQFTGPSKNNSEMPLVLKRDETQTVLLVCLAEGRPIPEVIWWKNDKILVEDDRYDLSQNNSLLEIKNVSESDIGRYYCYARNRVGEIQKYIDIKIAADNESEAKTNVAILPNMIVAIVLILIMIAWMIIRKQREMASRRRFMEATLQRFNAGALDCLDPELNMAEQAELLPYNKKWEFPRELLKFGKELGSGAFGIVRMADAKSICRSEAVTTVAVKVVRSTANLNHMTALQRELKILAYLGKHLNVVNLLGACTKHVSFGQLFVIVEFCRFGNLRDYLARRRSDFDHEAVNVAEEIDAGSSENNDVDTANDDGVSRVSCDMNTVSALFHRGTDSTDQSTAEDGRVSGQDPLEEAQRTNYQGDYEDENLEPISTRDLLCWAWQVARGMKFLGLRRVLHGDLAARNILLADHNVVKICDFGMAKTLFTDDNYQQKGNDPLPYKWMAIESLKDRVFSVHSDIWSYGVVLWEFYSLAKTPYSGIRPATLHEKLAEGFRMARPEHATPEIYQIMLHCWNTEPFERPSFAKLVEDISHLLEDNVKTHYFDLTASYVRVTADASEHEEPDYLTMNTSEIIAYPNEQSQA